MGFQKMKLIYALRSDKVDDGADSALLQDEGLPESKQSPIEKETTRGEETYIFALPSPSGLETHYRMFSLSPSFSRSLDLTLFAWGHRRRTSYRFISASERIL